MYLLTTEKSLIGFIDVHFAPYRSLSWRLVPRWGKTWTSQRWLSVSSWNSLGPQHSQWQVESTLPMLRLLSSKTQGCKYFWKTSKPCCVGIHSIALAEYSQISTHVPGLQSLFRVLRHFVLAKLATSVTSSIRVKNLEFCLLSLLLPDCGKVRTSQLQVIKEFQVPGENHLLTPSYRQRSDMPKSEVIFKIVVGPEENCQGNVQATIC